MGVGQATMKAQGQGKRKIREWAWAWWPLVPIYPYQQRRTLRRELVKDWIWSFEQVQGIFYVVVPIRMLVVRLEAGGLLVYAPIAPTPECLRLLRELETAYGPVQYIIHPTISGLEHKVFVGPFARQCPQAQVFVAPSQWSFPVNLPLAWLGFPAGRTQVLPESSSQAPFAAEFDYEILGPIFLGPGRFAEVAFFHRRSRSLLVTDTIVAVPSEPPEIVQQDPYPLLFHAKDSGAEAIADTPANRLKGWRRIALFAFYFRPSCLEVTETGRSLQEMKQAPDRSRQAYFGWFPFRWKNGWEQSFAALQGNGRPFVAPILQQLILNRAPEATLAWVKTVAQWDFLRILPCHLEAPIAATATDFQRAFAFLEPAIGANPSQSLLPAADFELLQAIDDRLSRTGIVPPAKTTPEHP